MRIIINLILLALIGLLGFTLYSIIKEPIVFQEAKTAKKNMVVKRLQDIRTSQEMFRDITGKFAHDFDTLASVLKTDSLRFERIEGDPDDPTNIDKFTRTVYFRSAIDSIRNMQINLDSLRYVPLASKGEEFTIEADTMTYQKTLVNVVEVGTNWKTFMGKYADIKYSKYDNSYDPNARIKFGDMSSPNISGNWED